MKMRAFLSGRQKPNEEGIGIVEVIAALGLSAVVLTSLVSLSLFTVRSSLQSKLLLEGTKLANKEIELVRAYRDGSTCWKGDSSGFCEDSTTGFLDTMMNCDNPGDNQVCSITEMSGGGLYILEDEQIIEPDTPEEITKSFSTTQLDGDPLQDTDEAIRVSVEVKWTVGGEDKYARLYTDLTNWANR